MGEGETNQLIDDDLNNRKITIKKFLFGWVKDGYDKTFLFILVIAFLIRIWVFTITYNQPLWWDSADYLATAKRWAGINPSLIDIWYYRRGILWPFLTSLFFRIGLGELSIRFFLVLLSTGIVFITYFLISDMFNKKLALLTSIGIAGSWVFLFFTGRPLTNLPSAFFLLTALLFFWRGYYLNKGKIYFYLFGIFAAFAALIRMQELMFALPILFLVLIKEKHKAFVNKGLWISVLMFAIIFIPQFIMHNAHFGNPILDLTSYYLGVEGISKTGEVGVELAKFSDLFLYFNNLPYVLNGNLFDPNNAGYSNLFVPIHLYLIYWLFVLGTFIFFIDLILGIDKIFKNEEVQKRAFIFVWIVSALLFLGYIAPHLEQRYIMQTLPFLFLIVVYPSVWIESFLKRKFSLNSKAVLKVIVFFFILLMIPNFLFGKGLIELKKTSYQEIKWAGEWIKENSNSKDIVIGGSWPQLTYYSERSIYPFHLAYRRDLEKKEEADLNKFILENRPKYFSISIFENEKPWAFEYPSKHRDILTPVKVIDQNGQPVLVIYEFSYENISSLLDHSQNVSFN